jgi:outer membrane protein assembly factor BamB
MGTGPGSPGYVGVIPGGVGYNLGQGLQGKVIIFFDIENGRSLRAIEDNTALLGSYISPEYAGSNRPGHPAREHIPADKGRMGMAVAPISYFNHPDGDNNSTSGGTLREFFTSDSEGHILYSGILSEKDQNGNITGVPVSRWRAKSIFRARVMEGPNRGGPLAIPVALTLGRNTSGGGNRWLFSGTAPVEGPDGKSRIVNAENYIFALNLDNHPAYMPSGQQEIPSTNSPTFASASERQVRTLANLGRVLRERDSADLGQADAIPSNAVTEQHYGWLIRLRPPVSGREGEYVSAPPFVFNGVLYVATFTPHSFPGVQCESTGDGRLYALNPSTGGPMWGHSDDNRTNKQSHLLKNVMITGLSSFRGNLFLGIKPLTADAVNSFSGNEDTRNYIDHSNGSVIEISPAVSSATEETIDVRQSVPHIQYYRETSI